MASAWRSLLASCLVILAGTGLLWWGTDGFQALTAESARRVAVLKSPRPLPSVHLQDQDGQYFTLADYQGQLLAVEFIYTRCETLCRSLGMVFLQLQQRFSRQTSLGQLSLLSISFDPEHDVPSSLKTYGETYGADGRHWRIARVSDPTELAALLQAFGVVAIDDGLGGFEHNAALHLLERDGRLVLIDDFDQLDAFEQDIRARL